MIVEYHPPNNGRGLTEQSLVWNGTRYVFAPKYEGGPWLATMKDKDGEEVLRLRGFTLGTGSDLEDKELRLRAIKDREVWRELFKRFEEFGGDPGPPHTWNGNRPEAPREHLVSAELLHALARNLPVADELPEPELPEDGVELLGANGGPLVPGQAASTPAPLLPGAIPLQNKEDGPPYLCPVSGCGYKHAKLQGVNSHIIHAHNRNSRERAAATAAAA